MKFLVFNHLEEVFYIQNSSSGQNRCQEVVFGVEQIIFRGYAYFVLVGTGP
jgi:hypothetical protein